MSRHPAPVSVSGGTHGIEVDEQHLRDLANAYGRAGKECTLSALSLHAYLVDPDIALSGLFDPTGYAAFQAALLAALDAPLGLTWAGARCLAADAELHLAILAYRAVEATVEKAEAVVELPLALAAFLGEYQITGNLSLSAQHAITRFPAAADAVMDALALRYDIRAKADAIDDGHGVAVRTGDDRQGVAGRPPRRLADIVDALGQRDDDPHHGAIDIRFLTRADGSRAVIVDISGTKSWSLRRTPDVTSLVTNGRALIGQRTSYQQGVLQAMKDAGVTSTDDVMLVGHSEGGMVAVNTARDAVRSGQYHVTHVITAGSPVGLTVGALPRSVNVLALENTRDVVPHLDGAANPEKVNVTTVSGAHGDGSVGDDHGTKDGYGPLARDTDASSDPSVRDYLRSCRGYFDATSVDTRTYQIVRHYR